MLIGARHPEIFSAIGVFSPVIYEGTALQPFRELPIDNLLKKNKSRFYLSGSVQKKTCGSGITIISLPLILGKTDTHTSSTSQKGRITNGLPGDAAFNISLV